MKTVYFVRHAKSSWADFSLKDIDRPLNKRGKRDAPFMANLMKEKGVLPDAIVSSPANRAFTTATHFAKAFGIKKKEIIVKSLIYEAFVADIFKIVRSLPDQLDTIFLFGHNPTFTNLANLFTNQPIDNIPTCGIFKIESDIASWKEFSDEKGKLTEFHYPKQYF